MSAETKKEIEKIKQDFVRIVKEADDASKRAAGFDKDLAGKIQKVREGGKDVVTHIEKRSA